MRNGNNRVQFRSNALAFFCILILLISACKANAAGDEISPGEYIREGGDGRMLISKGTDGSLSFTINAQGSRGHSCGLAGVIKKDKATISSNDFPDCVVRFAPVPGEIGVSDDPENNCHRAFCGMRADFQGTYLQPGFGCDTRAKRKVRMNFKSHYDNKDYSQALAALEPLLQKCGKTLSWVESGSIRNDVALTKYKLNDFSGCLQTLEPMSKDIKEDDASPMDIQWEDERNRVTVLNAARFNARLCSSMLKNSTAKKE